MKESDKPKRFGVIGFGDVVFKYFYPAFRNYENEGIAEIAKVADVRTREDTLERLHSKYTDDVSKRLLEAVGEDRISYHQIDGMLDQDFFNDIHCVYVASTNESHRDYVLQAIENRKHVLCEKPPAVSVEDVGEMARAEELANEGKIDGIVCMETEHYVYKDGPLALYDENPCPNFCTSDASEIIKKAVDECGPVTRIEGKIVEEFSRDVKTDERGNVICDNNMRPVYDDRLTNTVLDWSRGGGITRDTMCHLLAMLQKLGARNTTLNDVKAYNFDPWTFKCETASIAKMYVSEWFGVNIEVDLEVSKFKEEKDKYLRIDLGPEQNPSHGIKKPAGGIFVDFDENSLVYHRGDDESGSVCRFWMEPHSSKIGNYQTAFWNLIGRFLDSVDGKKEVLTTFSDALWKMGVIDEIYKKLREKYGSEKWWSPNPHEYYRTVPRAPC